MTKSPNIRLIRLGLLLLVCGLATGPVQADGTLSSRSDGPRLMSVTIDDLPVAPPGRHTLDQEQRITEELLSLLVERGVPAIGFVNEKKLETDSEVDDDRVALLERWVDAGMALGNHGYSHLSLHRVEAEAWIEDVLRGERVSRPLVESKGREFKWFRHPFLHAGDSVEVQDRTREFLESHGYRIAPVTVDNSEWIYADVYAHAWNAGDEALMRRVGEDYVRYMLEVVEFYEDQSRQIVGELIPQTLLVHANALNADWLGELLDVLHERGYRWVDIETATDHPAYQRAIDGYTGPAGITWLHRWAITADMDRGIFRGEPTPPDWIEELR